MNIDELLLFIEKVAKDNKISEPFIVGGVPRDRVIGVLGEKNNIRDIDITTGDFDSAKLSKILSKSINGSVYQEYDDGHSSVDYMGVHIDFSSNFVVDNIDAELFRIGVKNVDSVKREVYSRDFTINTLLEKLDFSEVYDITGRGIGDIKSKIIICPINPDITIGVDPRRILRAIKFCIKYDFSIDPSVDSAMKKFRWKIKDLPEKFVQDKMNEIVSLNPDKGIDLLIKYKLLSIVSPTKMIYDILIQKRKLLKAI